MISLFQWKREEDGVLQKGKHKAKVVGPSGSVSPASAISGISTARGTAHLYVCAFEKSVSSTLWFVSQDLLKSHGTNSTLFPLDFKMSTTTFICLCRNWPAEGIALLSLMKRYSLNLVFRRSQVHRLHIKQGPRSYSWNGTSRDAWKHILALQGEGIWQEIYLVILACTHRKTAVDLTQCGVLSTKPHLMLDTLPTCLHAINCLLRQDVGRAEESRLCENI